MTLLSALAADTKTELEPLQAGPLARYRQQLAHTEFIDDPSQYQAIEALEALYLALTSSNSSRPAHRALTGLYLWGDVGRGKTFLMDLFYNSVENTPKLRLHFHRFMARIHQEMMAESGNREPLARIAKRIAGECKLLCFDEFFVSDIGDAMILGKLFEALFNEGVTLVTTSNIPINELYRNGLQRQRFLATIDLLNQFTQEIHLNGEADHRLRHSVYQQRYFINNTGTAQSQHSAFAERFSTMTASAKPCAAKLVVHSRVIDTIKYTDNIAWFRFDALCDGPRSQLDYIEIATRFNTVMVSEVPILGGEPRSWIRARGTEDGVIAIETGERQLSYAVNDDPARRFISLVDELYDQGVTLYIQADVAMEDLYTGGALSFEFRRTLSRLTQMQSLTYVKG
ncbi:AFG1 family ATPase [Shewanella gelidimarina]|uniref:cell division protein ZapE n=1 Tax=Shewanella gelidimarina TaxID=56813 RepID=UPI0020106F75|nr:cell division protein ZapE [Shewanella gelidimarina]MCL1058772.1 AFG1 family ATPase [Shewanella gelidimarina]